MQDPNFAKVGVGRSNRLARSKITLENKRLATLSQSVAKPFFVLGWDWGTPSIRCRFFSVRADQCRCVLCPNARVYWTPSFVRRISFTDVWPLRESGIG